MYEVKFTTSAKKYFKKIVDRKLKKAFKESVQKLSLNPYCGEKKSGDLKDFYGYDMYYSGINYEIAYLIYESPDKKIIIVLAGSRENFYEQLKRYTK